MEALIANSLIDFDNTLDLEATSKKCPFVYLALGKLRKSGGFSEALIVNNWINFDKQLGSEQNLQK